MAEMTDDVQNQKLTLKASTFSRNAVSKVKSQRSRYVSYKMRIASCHADLRVLGHKMVNDTKAASFKTQGVLAPLLVRARRESNGRRGNRGTGGGVIYTWQEISQLLSGPKSRSFTVEQVVGLTSA